MHLKIYFFYTLDLLLSFSIIKQKLAITPKNDHISNQDLKIFTKKSDIKKAAKPDLTPFNKK